MKIGNRIFDTKHDCYIMGILNVTPDSFSDGRKVERHGEGKTACCGYDRRGGSHC